jgi:choline dehydrogenase
VLIDHIAASSETFDFVICGAGSAGCVLADRLSRDGRCSVCVLEAGGMDNWIWFHIPVGYLFAIGNPKSDRLFKTEPEPGLNGRTLDYPRGKVIGGSSTINAMLYMRGQASDYDGWRQIGLPGWGWEDVLPYFVHQEDYFLGANEFHGAGGQWRVDKPRLSWEILDRFIDAAEQSGIPRTRDFNTGNNEGCGYFNVNQKNGRRWSAARGFLKPALTRANLSLRTKVLIDRLTLDGKRVTGVIVRQGSNEQTIGARFGVILAAGSVASSAILERSGIGRAEILQPLGIEVRHALLGVGENLHDHLQIRPIFEVSGVKTMNTEYKSLLKRAWMGVEYALFRTGPLTMAPPLGAFTRTSPEYATPNVQFHIMPLSLEKFGDPFHPFGAITVSVCNLRPTSRGSVHVRSRDPCDAPIIRPNYLSTTEDRRTAIDSLRLARRIIAAPALARYRPEEYKPGAHLTSDDELAKAAGDTSTTIFHPVGTAKMGADNDPMAVVDPRLRVRGLDGLRVIDASIMPSITSGNTNSPTMMIAEKGAEMVLQDAGYSAASCGPLSRDVFSMKLLSVCLATVSPARLK